LSDAAHSGLDGLSTQPSIHANISEKENRMLSNKASFFGLLTAKSTRKGRGTGAVPRPMSALRMMTTGDEEGRSFWGPNGIITKSLASFRAAVAELRALVARQAAAILRLLNHLANPGRGAVPAAIAAGSAPAPAALARPAPPATTEPQPSPPMLEIAELAPARAPATCAGAPVAFPRCSGGAGFPGAGGSGRRRRPDRRAAAAA
jgi:hypothetical protein